MTALLSLQPSLHFTKAGKERIEKVIQLIPGGRQGEGSAIEQFHAQLPLQLQNLPAHRRLLNTVGHFPHGRSDPLILRNKVEQFKVVDVHFRPRGSNFNHQFNQYFRDFN